MLHDGGGGQRGRSAGLHTGPGKIRPNAAGTEKNALEELCEIEQEYEKQKKLLKQLEKRLKIAQKAAKKEKKIHKKKA